MTPMFGMMISVQGSPVVCSCSQRGEGGQGRGGGGADDRKAGICANLTYGSVLTGQQLLLCTTASERGLNACLSFTCG